MKALRSKLLNHIWYSELRQRLELELKRIEEKEAQIKALTKATGKERG